MQDVIGSTECAALLDCEPETVEALCREGQLPGFKVGRHWKFVRVDLLAFLAERGRAEAAERRSKRTTNVSTLTPTPAPNQARTGTRGRRAATPPALPNLPISSAHA